MNGIPVSIERVTEAGVLEKQWYPLFLEIFQDPTDRESLEGLLAGLRLEKQNHFYLIKQAGETIGIQQTQTHPEIVEAMYTPYGGLMKAHRGKGYFPTIIKTIRAQMVRKGIKYELVDFEDPARAAAAYPNDPAAVEKARRRILFYQRTGLCPFIVDDPAQPNSAYIRPASNDAKKIQAYDLLGFALLVPADRLAVTLFNPEKTAIRKEVYRRFYLETIQLQYGFKPEPQLRAAYPAVDRFLAGLDVCSEYIGLRKPVRS